MKAAELYIKLAIGVFDHPKTAEVASILGLSKLYTVAHLSRLWTWAVSQCPDGVMPAKAIGIASGADWEGDPVVFVEALVTAGYLDRDEDGVLTVHHWEEHAGWLVEDRRKRRDREALRRAERAAAEAARAGIMPARDVTVPARARHVPARAGHVPHEHEYREREGPLPPSEGPSPAEQRALIPVVALAAPPPDRAEGVVVLRGDPPARRPGAYPADFEAAWAIYPNKESKVAAHRAYQKTLKERRATSAELLAASQGRRQALDRALHRKPDAGDFVAHGATFFGPDEPWRDYLPGGAAMQREEPAPATRGRNMFAGIDEAVDRLTAMGL